MSSSEDSVTPQIDIPSARAIGLACVLLLAACTGGTPGGDPCTDRVCGEVDGKDCGSCPGTTEYCDDSGQCVEACAGLECGTGAEGMDCGLCAGSTEVCEAAGLCVDVCEDRECGEPVAGISCGSCTPPRECGLAGNCFAPGGCPPGSIEIPGQGYCIDPYEVTNVRFLGFLQDNGNHCRVEQYVNPNVGLNFDLCHPEEGGPGTSIHLYLSGGSWTVQPGFEDFPVTHVSLGAAWLACEHWGGHLCKLQEWEMACGGPQAWQYPYGSEYDTTACNTCNGTPEDVCGDHADGFTSTGSYPGCEGGYPGLFDMSGNVREWVDHCIPVGDDLLECVLKGGPWAGYDRYYGCYLDDPNDYQWGPPWYWDDHNGFRCCYYPE